jgi:hypothetical protein
MPKVKSQPEHRRARQQLQSSAASPRSTSTDAKSLPPPAYGVSFADRQTSSLRPGSGGDRMPTALQTHMENAFATDFSRVRVHQGPKAESIGARAYTRGNDIYFAPGQYSPHDRGGQALLGHELVHVVQQGQGRVASIQAKGAVTINSQPALEHEADVLGSLAARGERVHVGGTSTRSGGARTGSTGDVVQPAFTAKRALARMGKWTMMGPLHHLHIFFEDGKDPSNIGFMGKGGLGQDALDDSYTKVLTGLDDARVRDAVKAVGDPGVYSLGSNNCQDYVGSVLAEYNKKAQ